MDTLESTCDESDHPPKIDIIGLNDFDSQNWPLHPGNYRVFNAKKATGVVLLATVDAVDLRLDKFSPSIAIAGSLSTENLGIEHLVKNIIANPYIRRLIVWGEEIKGHFPGDALLNLKEHGVDSQKRIIRSRGGRPILKNLIEAEISHFRKQVEIDNLMGSKKISEFVAHLRRVEKLEMPPYEAGLKVDFGQVTRATPASRLKFDPAGYFVIMAMKGRPYPIVVEHYSNDGRLKNIIEGKDAATICATLVEMKLVSRTDHAAYMGRELARAETCLLSDIPYVQDKAQGELECQARN
ncbi:MAG: DUF4346 domain-containing protein [Desulfobacterales bacterium]|jgi:tetrahydromethanopterin S-methyltransferase subunit A